MQGELALAAALTAHGNSFLMAGPTARPPELFGVNATFRSVESIKFVDTKSTSDIWPKGTASWYERLRSKGAKKLLLAKARISGELHERIETAFAGRVPWAVQVEYPATLQVWFPQWNHAKGFRPWKVRCEGAFIDESMAVILPTPDEAKKTLMKELEAADQFCRRVGELGFADEFGKAIVVMNSDRLARPVYDEILPAVGYGLKVQRLLASAVQAWVFGGMGSFNDLGFGNRATNDEYNRIAESLYESVLTAILAAVNSPGE